MRYSFVENSLIEVSRYTFICSVFMRGVKRSTAAKIWTASLVTSWSRKKLPFNGPCCIWNRSTDVPPVEKSVMQRDLSTIVIVSSNAWLTVPTRSVDHVVPILRCQPFWNTKLLPSWAPPPLPRTSHHHRPPLWFNRLRIHRLPRRLHNRQMNRKLLPVPSPKTSTQ